MSEHERDFHLSNGIHFLRIRLNPEAGAGEVGFRIVQSHGGILPAAVPRLTGDIIMTASDFASVIAAMTPEGDNAETFAAALNFLTTGQFIEEEWAGEAGEGNERSIAETERWRRSDA